MDGGNVLGLEDVARHAHVGQEAEALRSIL
jgi:hypothetical protein